MKLKQRSDIITLTTGNKIQAEFFKRRFAILAWKNKLKMDYSSILLQYLTWYLSLNVLDEFLVWAIVVSHGFSSAFLKIAKNK